MARIMIIQGHPDSRGRHFCCALADAYEQGARQAAHELRSLDVGSLNFSSLRSADEFVRGEIPPDIKAAQESVL